MPWTVLDGKLKTGKTAGGDLKTEDLLVEHKRVEPHVKSVSIKRDWLRKVTEGANQMSKYPALALTFEDAKGHEKDWIAFPMSLAEHLLRKLREEE
jgi:hypothetical protein